MNKEVPKWLQDLQESSWELELLISGGAIFSLLQASDFFTETIESVAITNSFYGLAFFLLMGAFAIQGLTIGFMLHLVLRAFWLAMVCINYAYPQGVQAEKMRWQRPFKPRSEGSPDLYDQILKTDALCGIVIYVSIIGTFLVAGLVLLLVLLTLPIDLLKLGNTAAAFVYFWLLVLLLVLYILDLLFFGFLRRTPGLSYLLYPLFRLFDLVSLRFVFQRSLWIFTTNIHKLRLALFFGVFFVLVFLISTSITDRSSQPMPLRHLFDQRLYQQRLAPNAQLSAFRYLDELEGSKVRFCAIPSKVIEKEHLEVFVVYRKELDRLLLPHQDSLYLADLLVVGIDDSTYREVKWHPHWKAENDQLGITAMIPIRHLPKGLHRLQVSTWKDTGRGLLVIPFWKVEK